MYRIMEWRSVKSTVLSGSILFWLYPCWTDIALVSPSCNELGIIGIGGRNVTHPAATFGRFCPCSSFFLFGNSLKEKYEQLRSKQMSVT